jgi:Protein of unknown function DUF82.
MKIIIFVLIAAVSVSLIIYLSLKRKTKCSNCNSADVVITGKKKYEEDPVAISGSPNSYHQIEYKCNNCGNTFWKPKDAAIFN